jgi:hypothetical protein
LGRSGSDAAFENALAELSGKRTGTAFASARAFVASMAFLKCPVSMTLSLMRGVHPILILESGD